jgi:hypothetical protein
MAKGRRTSKRRPTRRCASPERQQWLNSPEGRLNAEGASKSKHINRRTLWLANRVVSAASSENRAVHERGACQLLPNPWHQLRLAALGDPGSLQQMIQARRMWAAAATPESLTEKLARLSESEREIIRRKIDEFAERLT